MNRKPLTLLKPMTLEAFAKSLMSVPKADVDEESARYEREKTGRILQGLKVTDNGDTPRKNKRSSE